MTKCPQIHHCAIQFNDEPVSGYSRNMSVQVLAFITFLSVAHGGLIVGGLGGTLGLGGGLGLGLGQRGGIGGGLGGGLEGVLEGGLGGSLEGGLGGSLEGGLGGELGKGLGLGGISTIGGSGIALAGKKAVVNYIAPPKYEFKYAVQDPYTGDLKEQQESRIGDLTKSEYELAEKDRKIQVSRIIAGSVPLVSKAYGAY